MTFETHVTGLGFPEGPQVEPDGSLVFVDLLHQNVRRYADGKASVVATLQGSPNGMRRGPDGRLYIANNGGVSPEGLHDIKVMDPLITGRIQRLGASGAIEDVVTELEGKGPWRPNDLIFAPDGRIVFSDPQNWEEVKDWKAEGRIPGYGGGRIFLGDPTTGKAKLLAEIYGFTNGLAFHPDGSLLVGMTLLQQVVRFPWLGDSVGPPEVWCQFDDGTAPDGMLFHEGLLYVAGSVGDRCAAVDLQGRVVRRYETGPGSDPTNLCIHAGRLWITLGTPGKLISCPL